MYISTYFYIFTTYFYLFLHIYSYFHVYFYLFLHIYSYFLHVEHYIYYYLPRVLPASYFHQFIPISTYFLHVEHYIYYYLSRPLRRVDPSIEILWRLKSEPLLTFSNIVPQCGTFTTKVWY